MKHDQTFLYFALFTDAVACLLGLFELTCKNAFINVTLGRIILFNYLSSRYWEFPAKTIIEYEK